MDKRYKFLFSFFLSLIVVFFISSCGKKKPEDIKEFQELITELDHRNADIMQKRQEIQDILQAYNQSVPEEKKVKFNFGDGQVMTPEEEKTIRELLQKEKDVSYQGLLKQVVEKNSDIENLQRQIAELQSRLPKPYDVKRGDTHYKLCVKYVMEVEGLSRAQADSLVDRVALITDLVKGFQVWFYYNNGVFGTFVTQGTAKISPSRLARITRRKVIEEARAQGRTQAFEEIMDSLQRHSMYDSLQEKPMNDTTMKK